MKWVISQNKKHTINIDNCIDIYVDGLGNTIRIFAKVAGATASTIELGSYRKDHGEKEYGRFLQELGWNNKDRALFVMADEDHYFNLEDKENGNGE